MYMHIEGLRKLGVPYLGIPGACTRVPEFGA